MSKSRWIAGVMSAAALLVGANASATTVEKLSFAEMIASAEACVKGEVFDSVTISRDGETWTKTYFRVLDTAFGSTRQTIVLETAGGYKKMGRLNGAEVVAGSPAFFDGQEAVLFITDDPYSPRYNIVGFNQGLLRVDNGNVTVPGNAGGIMSVDSALDMISAERLSPGTNEVSE